MYIDQLNLNIIRVFESVYRQRSMTLAATELHLTQSGVSQHVKQLENFLDIKLFDRVKQRLVPTGEAKALYKSCSQALELMEHSLMEAMEKEGDLKGDLCIGLPVDFGNSIVIPLLSEMAKIYSNFTYQITYGHASELEPLLINGDLDLAIFDDYSYSDAIKGTTIYNEQLFLCCKKGFIQNFDRFQANKKNFEGLPYISYLENASVLRKWFQKQFKFTKMNLKIKATAFNVLGVGNMISNGLGLGVLPGHAIKSLESKGVKLSIFLKDKKPVSNPMKLVHVDSKTFSPFLKKVRDELIGKLKQVRIEL